jgi:hypothetical protein
MHYVGLTINDHTQGKANNRPARRYSTGDNTPIARTTAKPQIRHFQEEECLNLPQLLS